MDEGLLEQVLAVLIDVFLVVGNQGLGWFGWSARFLLSPSLSLSPSLCPPQCTNCLGQSSSISNRIYLADGLSDGVNLAGLTTSGHAYTDVDIGELI